MALGGGVAALALVGCGGVAEPPATRDTLPAGEATSASAEPTEGTASGDSEAATEDAEFSCWDTEDELEALLEAMPGQSGVTVTLEDEGCGTSTSSTSTFAVEIEVSSDAAAGDIQGLLTTQSDFYLDEVLPHLEISPRPTVILPGGARVEFAQWYGEGLEVPEAAAQVLVDHLDSPLEGTAIGGVHSNAEPTIPNPTLVMSSGTFVDSPEEFHITIAAKPEDLTAEQQAELDRLMQAARDLGVDTVTLFHP